MNNNTQHNKEKVEAFLPPAELIQKYEELGIGEDLISLVREEQEHRHRLQKKYLLCYIIGQILGFVLSFIVAHGVYDLILKGYQKEAYILLGVFFVLTIYIFSSVRKDRDTTKRKRQSYIARKGQAGQRNYNNNNRNYYRK